MPTTRRQTRAELIEIKANALQKFSQCVYDILQIVKTIIEFPNESKELNFKYISLLDSLKKEMTLAENLKFDDARYSLPVALIFISHREEQDKKILYKAEKNLKGLLFKIEMKRIELLGVEYKPSTGIKDDELRTMLEKQINKKPIQTIKILNAETTKDIDDDQNDNSVLKTISSRVERGKRILSTGSIEVDIGSINNITNKLYECLSPLGTTKRIDTVFDSTSSPKGKYANVRNLTQIEKEGILRNRLKELQRHASKKEVKFLLKFNHANSTVYMDMKK